MKVAIVVQSIKDPVKYTGEFLRVMRQMYGHFELRVFSDVLDGFFPDFPHQHALLFSQAFASYNGVDITTDQTADNIRRQILISKQLGRKANSIDLIQKHLELLAFYHEHFLDFMPDVLVVWNGITHSFQTASVEIARMLGIPVVFLERGLISDSVFYDFKGVNAQSSIMERSWLSSSFVYEQPNMLHEIRRIVFSTRGGVVHSRRSSAGQKIRFPLEDYIFFPLQRDIDSNLLFNSPLVDNMYSLLDFLNGLIDKPPILVRPHPEDPAGHYTKKLTFKNLVVQEHGDLLKMITHAKSVLTVNSTVGFTAMILNKPIISLGKSVYSKKDLCLEIDSWEKLRQALNSDITIDEVMQKRRELFVNGVVINHHLSFNAPELLNIQKTTFTEHLIKQGLQA